ncbi:hypothetical protein LTR84_012111 [Exophiala bonariae]|uniref:BTB domain-containing protein n=1 Tax=Exophiala bonariae TaxID=1690606 RepID=A0AAV9NFM2_9EURO|nr:hypothetical protein LTR84_012111 [Exophiala bonariae]
MLSMRDSSRSRDPQARAMDGRHRKLFVEWTQSDRVRLCVGESIDTPKEFLVPVEFLRRRSREFQRLIHIHSDYLEQIKLPETRISTFEDFLIWTFTPQPKIGVNATFDEAVHLGVFAWKYQIPSLSNQVTDVIRAKLAEKEWPLEASIVDNIYGAVPSKCPLREVVRAALGQLPRPNAEGEVLKDEWKATFLKHAELGWDYIQAAATEWTKRDYLTDYCKFHDHQGVSHRGSFAECDGCPFAHEDCYPDEPEEVVDGSADAEAKAEPPASEDVPVEDASSDGTTVHKIEEPVEPLPLDQHEIGLTNGNASEDPALESTDNGVETPMEAPMEDTDQLKDATDDDFSGTKETDSVAEVDGTTVTSEGPGDDLNSLKENESVVGEVEERSDVKLTEMSRENSSDLKIDSTKAGEVVVEQAVPESKKPKKNKSRKRHGSKTTF